VPPRCPRVPVDDTDNDDRFDTLCSIFPRLLRFHVVATEVERSHAERVEAKGKADRERSVQIGEGFRRNGGGNGRFSLSRSARSRSVSICLSHYVKSCIGENKYTSAIEIVDRNCRDKTRQKRAIAERGIVRRRNDRNRDYDRSVVATNVPAIGSPIGVSGNREITFPIASRRLRAGRNSETRARDFFLDVPLYYRDFGARARRAFFMRQFPLSCRRPIIRSAYRIDAHVCTTERDRDRTEKVRTCRADVSRKCYVAYSRVHV